MPDAELSLALDLATAAHASASPARAAESVLHELCRRTPVAAADRPHGLTVRELQVLTLLAEGLLNTAIAHRLGITERTAAHHVEHVLGKLGVPGRTAAARHAVEHGLRLLEP